MNNSLRGRDYINIHDLSSEDFRGFGSLCDKGLA